MSLINLLHLPAWQDINRSYDDSLNYFRSGPPSLVSLAGLILSELALTAVLLSAATYARHNATRGLTILAQWTFLGVLCLAIDINRREFVHTSTWFPSPARADAALIALELLILTGAVLLLFRVELMLKICAGVTLALSPLMLISTICLLSTIPPKSAFEVKLAKAVTEPQLSQPRILWLIFDCLDQQFCFDLRPPSIQMPELDRLRKETLFASQARAAGPDTTPSLPSLISGRLADDASPSEGNDLLVRYKNSKSLERWSRQPNIFEEAGQMGYQPGLVGWFHPYARIFPGQLYQVAWRPNVDASGLMLRQQYVASSGIATAVEDQLMRDLLSLPLSRGAKEKLKLRLAVAEMDFLRRRNLDDLVWLRQRALQMIVDPNVNFLFMHLPVPHPLGIYDRNAHELSLNRSSNYFDNLELVDSLIGEFRHSMEKAGLWDETVVLVSSDHGFRPRIWRNRPSWTPEEQAASRFAAENRVPFLLKMGHQKEGVAFDREFNTVISHDLILAVCRRQINTVEDAVAWLAKRVNGPELQSASQKPLRQLGAVP